MVNGGTRAWLNNAGISSGVQIFIDQFKITPLDGSMDITPNKVGRDRRGMSDDVRKFMQVFEIPNRGGEGVDGDHQPRHVRLAEELSNIPLVSQGKGRPERSGRPSARRAAEQQTNTLRQLAYSPDDHVTEPLVDDFYEWAAVPGSAGRRRATSTLTPAVPSRWSRRRSRRPRWSTCWHWR